MSNVFAFPKSPESKARVADLTRSHSEYQREQERKREVNEFMHKAADLNIVERAHAIGGKWLAKCLRDMADAIEPIQGRLEK